MPQVMTAARACCIACASTIRTVVTRAAILDIIPQHHLLNNMTPQWGRFSWHWLFNIQPDDLPESMMGADPDWFIKKKLAKTEQGLSFFDKEALAEYMRCFRNPATAFPCPRPRRAPRPNLIQLRFAADERGAPEVARRGLRLFVRRQARDRVQTLDHLARALRSRQRVEVEQRQHELVERRGTRPSCDGLGRRRLPYPVRSAIVLRRIRVPPVSR